MTIPARRGQLVERRELALGQTPLVIGDEVSVLGTSDGLGWPDLNATLTIGRPHGHQIVHGASADLWVMIALDPTDITMGFGVGAERLQLPAHCMLLVPPETPLTVQRTTQTRMLHVFLTPQVLCDVAGDHFDRPLETFEFRPMLGVEDLGSTWMLRSIKQLLLERARQSDLNIRYLSHALAANLLRKHALSRPGHLRPATPDRLTTAQLRRVLEYAHDHLSSEIRLNDLAAVAGLSRSVFVLRFKASMHETPHQYLMNTRIRRGMELLATTDLSIGAIGHACGFADHAHFSVAFRRAIGATPSDFRRGAK